MAHASGSGYASYMPALGVPNNATSFASGPTKAPYHNTVEDLINAIRTDIEASEQSTVPKCTTSEMTLSMAAWVPLHQPKIGPYAVGGAQDLPPEFKTSWISTGKDGTRQQPQASVHAIISAPDQYVRQPVQRSASRGIVNAIEKMDGFKYTFNNAWAAKDDDGMRFSYICQDSTQNKDRHANGFTRTTRHIKNVGERGPRKPTFDCKGSVSVKFSLQRGCVDVYYRHYAIHPTVKERKPPPRPAKGTRKADVMNYGSHLPRNQQGEGVGGLAGELQDQDYADTAPSKSQASNIGKSRKRKRDSDAPLQSGSTSKPLSLAEILKQSASAKPKKAEPRKAAPSNATKANGIAPPAPLNYDLPSWQPPPQSTAPQQQRPKPTTQPTRNPGDLPPSYQPPYLPPYQPTQPTQPPQAPPLQIPANYHSIPQQLPPSSIGQKFYTLSKEVPKAQGLFTTMKPAFKGADPTRRPVYRGFAPEPSQVPAKASCTNCRYGQKECDGTRPICNGCARAGKYDCVYDNGKYPYAPGNASPWAAQPPPVPPMQYAPPPPPPPPPPPQFQAQPPREESPDPWFPKR